MAAKIDQMPDDRPLDRRRFFRIGLRELLKPLANTVAPIERALKELEALENLGGPSSTSPPKTSKPLPIILRPPGALPEQAFRSQCSRCGVCVSVCPAEAIKIDSSGTIGNGAPYIVASEAACVACDGLHCMQNCPSGALVFTPLADIDIGTAEWRPNLCTRTVIGDDCKLCVEHCPLGEAAIRLDDAGRVEVIEAGCIGCGVCEQFCPTTPQKAIVVIPKAQRDTGSVSRS